MPPKKPAEPSDAFQKVALTINDPRTLVLALQAPEPDVCGAACTALNAFATLSEKNKLAVLEAGAVAPLSALLVHVADVVRHPASQCLCTLAAHPQVRASWKASGKLDFAAVVALLAEPSPVAQENGALLVAALCPEYSTRVALAAVGAVPALVPLLAPPAPGDVIRAALSALLPLLDEYDNRSALAGTEGVARLNSCLVSEFDPVVALALQCIPAVARSANARTTLRHVGTLEQLLDMANDATLAVHHERVLVALGSLLVDPESVARLSEQGPATKTSGPTPAPVTKLFALLQGKGVPAVQVQAALCVAQAAQHPTNRRLLLDQKVEAALAPKLYSDDPKAPLSPAVAAAASTAVAALAAGVSNSEVFAQLGSIKRLQALLVHADPLVTRAAAAACAALLAQVPLNRATFVQTDVLKPLTELLAGGDPASQEAVATIYAHLAADPAALPAVRDKLPVAALLPLLASEDARVALAAASAAATLALDPFLRRKMVDSQGLKALPALLASSVPQLRQAGCRLVVACQGDAAAAAYLDTLRLIGPLRALATNDAAPSAVARAAYAQLVNQNLPQKYALFGVLHAGDAVGGATAAPFYDPGPLPLDAEVPTLAALQHEPLRPGQRAVVTVDATSLAPLLARATQAVAGVTGPAARAAALAALVSDVLGGPVPLSGVAQQPWALALADLQRARNSAVVPLAQLSAGTYAHRALLFKALADGVGLPSALVRGRYHRAYNVLHGSGSGSGSAVVDVMHMPGTLHPVAAPAEDNLAALEGNFFDLRASAPL